MQVCSACERDLWNSLDMRTLGQTAKDMRYMVKGWNGGWVFMLMLVATCSRGAKHAIISRSVESGPAGLGHKRGASCREFHFHRQNSRGRTDCEKAAEPQKEFMNPSCRGPSSPPINLGLLSLKTIWPNRQLLSLGSFHHSCPSFYGFPLFFM